MTDEQIKQKAEIYATERYGEYDEHDYTDHSGNNLCHAVSEEAFIAGAHSRDEEVEMLQNQIEELSEQLKMNAENIQKLRNPWISVEDRLPEEKLNEEGYGKGYSERVFVRFERVYDHGQKDVDYDTSNYMNVTKTWLNHNRHYTYYTDRITHWMPVFDPLKGGEK